MRYERIRDVLELTVMLHAPGSRVTIEQVQERFGVARRTAERMRSVVEEVFPDLDYEVGSDGRRRWFLPGGRAMGLLRCEEQEIDALRKALGRAARGNDGAQEDALRSLLHKLEPAAARARD